MRQVIMLPLNGGLPVEVAVELKERVLMLDTVEVELLLIL